MVEPRSLGGIKLSDELVQFDFQEPIDANSRTAVQILDLITRAKINMVHMHQGPVAQSFQTTICCGQDEFKKISQQVEKLAQGFWYRIILSVGTITLFPHGGDPAFPAEVLKLLREGRWLCMASAPQCQPWLFILISRGLKRRLSC